MRFWLLLLLVFFSSCTRYLTETGQASFYADSLNGRKTASGKVFHNNQLTAAHKTLPFGTRVTVKNVRTGKKVKVTITDRGPFVKGRIIDLTKKAARRIGMTGTDDVRIRYRKPKQKKH